MSQKILAGATRASAGGSTTILDEGRAQHTMGIFEKTVDAIQEADLQALVGVPESVILEYKRDVHIWDDIVKELDAFGNTFGGYLVLGPTLTPRGA